MKGLINIQSDDNKCFLWCYVRYLNCNGKNLFRIIKKDKEISKRLNYDGIKFPISKKDFLKISIMNKININVFSYEDKIIYPIYLSDQNFNDVLDLLLINNHYVLIKDFKWFCKSCLPCFSSKKILNDHGKDCLLINGGQRIKLEKGFIEFNNFNKTISCPFKIYADFECLLKNVDIGINNDCFSYTSKYQNHIPCSFAYKLVCIDDKFSKDVVLYRGKNAVFKFIQCIFNEYSSCKNVMKKHFNKNLIKSLEEEQFEKDEICWICNKLNESDKVRDHCHITGKYRGPAHCNCNINMKICKKLPIIFHNLRGYDGHLITKELTKFKCKINVIPNGLETFEVFFR